MATTGGIFVYAPDLAPPFGVVGLGAAANLPALPDKHYALRGVRMPHGVKTSFYMPVYFSATTSLGTGLTVSLLLAMDPNTYNADLGGTNAFFDVTATLVTSGTTIPDDSAFASSTADTGTASTLPTAVGKLVVLTITSAVAHENSLAVNAWGLLRIRRLGDNASDTNLGNVDLVGVAAVGT